MKTLSNKGFTIIELIIAMIILSVLTVMTVKSLSGFRMANRDNRRVSDVNEMQAAFEAFYRDIGFYPTAITAGQAITFSGSTYLATVPSNPQPSADGSCPYSATYNYQRTNNGLSYSLGFCLGSKTGIIGSGSGTAIPGDVLTCVPNCFMSCGAGSDGCGKTCSNSATCAGTYTCLNDHCIAN